MGQVGLGWAGMDLSFFYDVHDKHYITARSGLYFIARR